MDIPWGMLQRTNATTNSFYQYNQNATTNAVKTGFILQNGGQTPSNWWTSHRRVTQNQ